MPGEAFGLTPVCSIIIRHFFLIDKKNTFQSLKKRVVYKTFHINNANITFKKCKEIKFLYKTLYIDNANITLKKLTLFGMVGVLSDFPMR